MYKEESRGEETEEESRREIKKVYSAQKTFGIIDDSEPTPRCVVLKPRLHTVLLSEKYHRNKENGYVLTLCNMCCIFTQEWGSNPRVLPKNYKKINVHKRSDSQKKKKTRNCCIGFSGLQVASLQKIRCCRCTAWSKCLWKSKNIQVLLQWLVFGQMSNPKDWTLFHMSGGSYKNEMVKMDVN